MCTRPSGAQKLVFATCHISRRSCHGQPTRTPLPCGESIIGEAPRGQSRADLASGPSCQQQLQLLLTEALRALP